MRYYVRRMMSDVSGGDYAHISSAMNAMETVAGAPLVGMQRLVKGTLVEPGTLFGIWSMPRSPGRATGRRLADEGVPESMYVYVSSDPRAFVRVHDSYVSREVSDGGEGMYYIQSVSYTTKAGNLASLTTYRLRGAHVGEPYGSVTSDVRGSMLAQARREQDSVVGFSGEMEGQMFGAWRVSTKTTPSEGAAEVTVRGPDALYLGVADTRLVARLHDEYLTLVSK